MDKLKYAEFVTLKKEEFDKLNTRYGEKLTSEVKMNKIEKKVREIFEKYRNNLLCENCKYSEKELNCKDCGVDKLEKITDKQATTEIMAIMKAKNELWAIICKDKQTKIDKFQSDLAEKEKEIKQLMVFLKQTGAVQDQDGNWECTECEAVEETKRLRKELEQALKGEE